MLGIYYLASENCSCGVFLKFDKSFFNLQDSQPNVQNIIAVAHEMNFHVKNEPIDDDQLFYTNSLICTCCIDKDKQIEKMISEIAQLTNENEVLKSKCKQLEEDKTESESSDEDQHEVVEILQHRQLKTKQKFYVRWKGFGNDANSWVDRSDMQCPLLLAQYLKQHNLN